MSDREEHKKPGPTGNDGQYQEGDHYHHPSGVCIDLTAEMADDLNKQIANHKAAVAAAELTRLSFDLTRPCPKCRCTFPAEIEYKPDEASCEHWHGGTEHMDRTCLRCGYHWAENLP